MIHKMVAMARCYPAAVAGIVVAARRVAVVTRIVTVPARPARRTDRDEHRLRLFGTMTNRLRTVALCAGDGMSYGSETPFCASSPGFG